MVFANSRKSTKITVRAICKAIKQGRESDKAG